VKHVNKNPQKQLHRLEDNMKKGLYHNINERKKKGISRSKKDSTISDKAYKNMLAGFKKKK